MSITISFSMKPTKSWLPGNGWNQERLEVFSRHLAAEQGYHCDVIDNYVIYQFCPEGFLWMGWKNHAVAGDCQTNIAGPGFHAAVIHFLELFAARGNLALQVDDVTGYYEDRDFVRMRRNYFYQWFSGLMTQILERRDEAEKQLVCWPSDYYLPEEKQGMVTTHIRQFPIAEIAGMVRSGLSMAFARDFFIWNEEEKDAYFYRNCALVMMNQECYFMPSSRSEQDQLINQSILDLLEKALSMKADIPFPKKEYLELCELAEQEPVDVSKVTELSREVVIGCRRGLLFRTIGCMRFAVPGNFLYDAKRRGNADRYYDGNGEDEHDYYICAINTDQDAHFQEESFRKERIKEVQEFDSGQAKCKVAVYQPVIKDGRTVYEVSAQVIYKSQMTIITISYEKPEEQEWALDLIRKVRTID